MAFTPARRAAWTPWAIPAWCPFFQPAGEGVYNLATRAIDQVGNQETRAVTYPLYVDGKPPVVSTPLQSGAVVGAFRHPARQNTWVVRLGGAISDPQIPGGVTGSGVQTDSLRVTLLTPTGAQAGLGMQRPSSPAARGRLTIL